MVAWHIHRLTFGVLVEVPANESGLLFLIQSLGLEVCKVCLPTDVRSACSLFIIRRFIELPQRNGLVNARNDFSHKASQGLISLENDLRIFCQQMQEFNLDTTLFLTIPAWQAVTNLIGDAVDDPADLSGDIMDLEEFEASLRNGTNALATQVLLLFRMRLAVMFDRGHLMHELYWPIVRGRDKALKGHFTNLEAVCMEGLASYKLYHLNGTRKYRRQARKATRQLHVWAAGGVVNCGPPSLFLKAESIAASDKRRRRRKDEVVACYEKAIQGAQEMEVRQWEAVYTERLFQVMHRVYEDTTVAVEFLDKAIAAYERWEAFSKVEALEAQKMRLEALGR